MALDTAITDTVLMAFIVLLAMVVVYFIIREIRIIKTANRSTELELEKDKLRLLQRHEDAKGFPFTRFKPEQIEGIRQVEDEIAVLETDIFAKEKLIETRLTRLEDKVKAKKLDNLMGNIQEQEKKVS
jgi:flagellar biosynthesis/type III secretory pathway M-ring protein FliF/YscJ